MAAAEPGTPGARQLGGAPRDGDFARLLEAASAPSAHRVRVPAAVLGPEDAETRAARAGRYTGSPPADVTTRPSPADSTARPPPPDLRFGNGAPAPEDASRPGHGATFDLAAQLSAAAAAWARRPLKDRVITVLFGVAALWILSAILSAAARDPGDATGLLIVGIVIAFILLRGRSLARRGRSRPQPPPDAP